jgi:DNA-binding transcriptional MocR family regulator
MTRRGRAAEEIPLRFEWERVVKALPLPSWAKHVGLTLATYGNLAGEDVRPGVETVVGDTALSRATVFRALAFLRDVGLIEPVGTANRRRRQAETYRLAIPSDVLTRVVSRGAGRPVEKPPDQVSHRDVIPPDQVSHRDDQVSHRDSSGLTQRLIRSQAETPPEHDQLRDQLKDQTRGPVVDVSTDRARAVDGRPRRTHR